MRGKEGIITQINKALIERILNAPDKSNFGNIELSTPRDRHSTFEPQIIPKRSTKSAMLKETILSLYAKGMTTTDIQATLQDLYHVDVSPSLISRVTYVINEEVEQWRDRPREAVYPVVWLDGLVVKVNHDHQVLNKTIYLALAINMEGYKELLGIWISEHEVVAVVVTRHMIFAKNGCPPIGSNKLRAFSSSIIIIMSTGLFEAYISDIIPKSFMCIGS